MNVPAMILAAGRGERMRPLTDSCPKPLLAVHGRPLIEWHMEALRRGGFERQVVNTAWLGGQIERRFAQQPGLRFSSEGRDFGGALETAGGIARALPLLGDVFWVVAGDVFAPDFRFRAEDVESFVQGGKLARLWLVPNPAHHPRGDFAIDPEGLACNQGASMHTFSTIALYRSTLFAPPWCAIETGNPHGTRLALAPLLRAAIDRRQVEARLYGGRWTDVGTPERLAALNAEID